MALTLFLLAGCSGIKITKSMLKMGLASSMKTSMELFYADSCDKRIGVPYVADGDPAQVLDIYYADPDLRKGAVLIDIHGGFYVAGRRENNRAFASVFLKEGYDVVLLEYRLNDGQRDVSDELADCAAGLDYLASHAGKLGLDKDRMFLTGDSAGGHLALYMAEGAEDRSLPIHPEIFTVRGVLINCPAYDYATFGNSKSFSKSALEWFIRSQSLLIKEDCESLGRPLVFVDIASDDKQVGHVHNVTDVDLPESREVNARMIEFLDAWR